MEVLLLSIIMLLLAWQTLPDAWFEDDSDELEQPRRVAQDQIIDLHLHPEDRVYLLSRVDEAGDQGEIDAVLLVAQKVTTKLPLGMNV